MGTSNSVWDPKICLGKPPKTRLCLRDSGSYIMMLWNKKKILDAFSAILNSDKIRFIHGQYKMRTANRRPKYKMQIRYKRHTADSAENEHWEKKKKLFL